jgi:peroxiredoxin
MNIRKLNWPLWTGFALSLIAFLTYFLVFIWFPVTRDFPWVNLLLFALSAILLFVGVRRAFAAGRPRPMRSKVAGAILTTLGLTIFGLFIFFTLILARWLPGSTGAPQLSQKAPEFTLNDSNGKPVSLSELLASPVNGKAPKGVLLVFYRGYWWPACNSEFRGIQNSLSQLEQAGIRPVAISVDTPEQSRDLTQQAGYSFTFLSDPKAEVIRRYDVLHAAGGSGGEDIARPAEFLVDSSGTVRWVNLTENYWVRARPEQILEVAKTLQWASEQSGSDLAVATDSARMLPKPPGRYRSLFWRWLWDDSD